MGLIEKIFGTGGGGKKPPEKTLRVVEGIVGGVWMYHLAQGQASLPVCGSSRTTIETNKTLEQWGQGEHGEVYCPHCRDIAREQRLGMDGEARTETGSPEKSG